MKNIRRMISALLICIIILSFSLTGIAQLIDISSHWAEQEINYFIEKGILNGYPDRTFKPEKNVTRAEVYKMINKVIGYKEVSPVNFLDVKKSDWFYNDVAMGIKAGYVVKNLNETLMPNIPITREEVARIIGIAFGLPINNSKSPNYFLDENIITEEAVGYIRFLNDKGYISGYPDGSFKPKDLITRAEVARMISNITGEIINTTRSTISKDVKGNLLINTTNVTLKDMTIEGDLYLTQGIESGEATIENVIVKGDSYIRGGGVNSIYIKDSKFKKLTIGSQDRMVRVVIEGNTNIDEIVLEENVILVVNNSAIIRKLIVSNKSEIFVSMGSTIKELEVNSNDISIDSKGNIELIIANEKVRVNGGNLNKQKEGKVVNGKFKEINRESSNVIGIGDKSSHSDKDVSYPEINFVPISSIVITRNNLNIELGKMSYLTTNIKPVNTTNKSVMWKSSNENIAVVDETGRVTAIGIGTATIKVTSTEDSDKNDTCLITVTPQETKYTVIVDGVVTEFDNTQLYQENSSLWAPIRLISEMLSAEISWNQTTKIITIKKDEKIIYIRNNSEYSIIKNGTTFCDLDYISEGLGYNLTWDLNTRTFTFKSVELPDPGFVELSSLRINEASLSIELGTIFNLTTSTQPSNATNKSVTWESSNEEIAVVDERGKVTTKGLGIAIIKVTSAEDSSKSDICLITVIASVTKYTVIVDDEVKLFDNTEVHEENNRLWAPIRLIAEMLSAEVHWEGITQTVTFKRDDKSVSVGTNSEYLVIKQDRTFCDLEYITEVLGYDLVWNSEAKLLTFTTIDSTNPGFVPIRSININSSNLKVEVGTIFKLTTRIQPTNATNKSVIWESSNDEIATVNGTGLVNTTGLGTVLITVMSTEDGNIKDTCVINIVPSESKYIINIDGIISGIDPHTPFYEDNNRLWAPVRFIGEILSAEFIWDGDKQTVTFEKNGKSILASSTSGNLVIKDGTSFCDFEYISEGLGYDLNWDIDNRTLIFTTK